MNLSVLYEYEKWHTHTGEINNLSSPTNSFFYLEFLKIVYPMPCAAIESFICSLTCFSQWIFKVGIIQQTVHIKKLGSKSISLKMTVSGMEFKSSSNSKSLEAPLPLHPELASRMWDRVSLTGSHTSFNTFLLQSWNLSNFWTWASHFRFALGSTNYAAAPACTTDFVVKRFLNLFLLAWHFLTGKNLESKYAEWFTMVFTVVRHLLALKKRNSQTYCQR